jgi:hypothetical protein
LDDSGPNCSVKRSSKHRRRGLPLQRSIARVSHPAARPGVTTGPASPRGVAMPFSVFSIGAVAAHRIHRALLRPWNLADPGPWSLPTPTALPVVSDRVAHTLVGFHSPTGYGRSQPWHREPYHAWSSDRCHPSPGVSVPSAVVSTRDPVTPMTSTSPAPCVLRVLRPLDALLPLEPSDGCPPGRSWDSSLQGLAPAGRYGALSSMSRAFLTLPIPIVAR